MKKTEKLAYADLLPERKRNIVERSAKSEQVKPPSSYQRTRKRIGRGIGSGLGKTSGKGHKGQKARAGYSHRPGFEGGQTPIFRRLPKRGFRNIFKKDYQILNLKDLTRAGLKGEVSPTLLKERGLIKHEKGLIKILGDGDISTLINITADAFSQSACKKLTACGGAYHIREASDLRKPKAVAENLPKKEKLA